MTPDPKMSGESLDSPERAMQAQAVSLDDYVKRFPSKAQLAIAQALLKAREEGKAEAMESEPLVRVIVEVARFLNQAQALEQKQHRLLVEGQTLESASENWDEATMDSLDLNALREALEKFNAFKKSLSENQAKGKGE